MGRSNGFCKWRHMETVVNQRCKCWTSISEQHVQMHDNFWQLRRKWPWGTSFFKLGNSLGNRWVKSRCPCLEEHKFREFLPLCYEWHNQLLDWQYAWFFSLATQHHFLNDVFQHRKKQSELHLDLKGHLWTHQLTFCDLTRSNYSHYGRFWRWFDLRLACKSDQRCKRYDDSQNRWSNRLPQHLRWSHWSFQLERQRWPDHDLRQLHHGDHLKEKHDENDCIDYHTRSVVSYVSDEQDICKPQANRWRRLT